MNRIHYSEIVVKKITRNVYIATTEAWLESKPWFKMTFDIAGDSEQSARERLVKVLNAKPTVCHE